MFEGVETPKICGIYDGFGIDFKIRVFYHVFGVLRHQKFQVFDLGVLSFSILLENLRFFHPTVVV